MLQTGWASSCVNFWVPALGIWLGDAALAHTRLSFVPSALLHLPSFFRFDVLVTVQFYDPL